MKKKHQKIMQFIRIKDTPLDIYWIYYYYILLIAII